MRRLRLELREICMRLGSDKRFKEWSRPIDPLTPDGMAYVRKAGANPMELATLLDLVNKREVTTASAFADRLRQIAECAQRFYGGMPGEEAYKQLGRVHTLADEGKSCDFAQMSHPTFSYILMDSLFFAGLEMLDALSPQLVAVNEQISNRRAHEDDEEIDAHAEAAAEDNGGEDSGGGNKAGEPAIDPAVDPAKGMEVDEPTAAAAEREETVEDTPPVQVSRACEPQREVLSHVSPPNGCDGRAGVSKDDDEAEAAKCCGGGESNGRGGGKSNGRGGGGGAEGIAGGSATDRGATRGADAAAADANPEEVVVPEPVVVDEATLDQIMEFLVTGTNGYTVDQIEKLQVDLYHVVSRHLNTIDRNPLLQEFRGLLRSLRIM